MPTSNTFNVLTERKFNNNQLIDEKSSFVNQNSKTVSNNSDKTHKCEPLLMSLTNSKIVSALQKQRVNRSSRLDYRCHQSSINKSEFKGFLSLAKICEGLFFLLDPVCRYLDTGHFFDVSLAKVMFKDVILLLLAWLGCALWSLTAYFTYKSYYYGLIRLKLVRMIQAFTEISSMGFMIYLCLHFRWSILPSAFVLSVATIMFMKMHSFTETALEIHEQKKILNKKLDIMYEENEDKENINSESLIKCNKSDLNKNNIKVNDNITTKNDINEILNTAFDDKPNIFNFIYFLLCPVLVYEVKYPKGHPFRISYFCKKVIDLLAGMIILYYIVVRFLIPLTEWSTTVPLHVAILHFLWPILVCYLVFFFILFECICNLFAEITEFGDREFYEDWWNCTTWAEFSRKWNRPVHDFLLRHVYYKSLYNFNLSKSQALTITFLFSAFFHELILSVCFKMVKFWLLGLMLLQIPLITIGHHHEGTEIGNCIIWLGMIVGLPTLIILYGREYVRRS